MNDRGYETSAERESRAGGPERGSKRELVALGLARRGYVRPDRIGIATCVASRYEEFVPGNRCRPVVRGDGEHRLLLRKGGEPSLVLTRSTLSRGRPASEELIDRLAAEGEALLEETRRWVK